MLGSSDVYLLSIMNSGEMCFKYFFSVIGVAIYHLKLLDIRPWACDTAVSKGQEHNMPTTKNVRC